MDKRGPRAKRIAEREFRGALEQAFEAKVREPISLQGRLAARVAVAGIKRQTGR